MTLKTKFTTSNFKQWKEKVSAKVKEKITEPNPLSASVALIWKPVNWFAVQINWLVSIWGQYWHLMG